MHKPYYPCKKIGSIASLAKALNVNEKVLISIAANAESNYTAFEIESKNGKYRDVYEPKFLLKSIQKRINSQIFEKVKYPKYLQGGIRDLSDPRDYVRNASIHAGADTLVSLDIKDFYNSIKKDKVFDMYKLFFQFPEEVAKVLTELTTLGGRVPQGACTSSYVANLIFAQSEYLVISSLERKGVQYTRLLDDVTLSSNKVLDTKILNESISAVVKLFKSYGLRQNRNKKKVEFSHYKHKDYSVTGLWVGHGTPKLTKSERRYIRQLVFECEKQYRLDRTSEDYHSLWNRTSGKVAKMEHLGHAKSTEYRDRLAKILPCYSAQQSANLTFQIKKFVSKVTKNGYRDQSRARDRYYFLKHRAGICSRNNKVLAKSLNMQLKSVSHLIKTKEELWS